MLLPLVIAFLLLPASALLIHQFVRRSLDAVEPTDEATRDVEFELAKAA